MGKRYKYSKHLDDSLTLKELEIWHSQEVAISNQPFCKGRRGKTYEETREELNVTNKTIARTKQKTEYNALAQARLEQEGFQVGDYVKNLIRLTKATKGVSIRVEPKADGAARVTNRVQEPDNTTQFNAVSEIGDIFGAKAPKQVDLKHSMAAMSDDEIQDEIDKSVEEIEQNGRIQRSITGTLDAKTVVSTTIIGQKQTVAIVPGE